MSQLSASFADSLEVGTVKEILTSKLVQVENSRQLQRLYLVAWEEEEFQPTWEPVENLKNVQDMVDKYESTKEQKELEMRSEKEKSLLSLKGKTEAKLRKRHEKELRKGTLDNPAHRLAEVVGIKPSRHDGQLLCKVTWESTAKDCQQ